MALKMAQPWKHPRTGVYWFRKAVPLALHPKIAKREILVSLKTKDPKEAPEQSGGLLHTRAASGWASRLRRLRAFRNILLGVTSTLWCGACRRNEREVRKESA